MLRVEKRVSDARVSNSNSQQAEEDNEQRKRQEQILMEKLLEQEAMMEENQKVRVLSGSGGDGGLSRLIASRLIIRTHGGRISRGSACGVASRPIRVAASYSLRGPLRLEQRRTVAASGIV